MPTPLYTSLAEKGGHHAEVCSVPPRRRPLDLPNPLEDTVGYIGMGGGMEWVHYHFRPQDPPSSGL